MTTYVSRRCAYHVVTTPVHFFVDVVICYSLQAVVILQGPQTSSYRFLLLLKMKTFILGSHLIIAIFDFSLILLSVSGESVLWSL